jgi:putative transposase
MPPDPTIPHRLSLRLKEYDYSQSGAYFVTLVTQDRKNLWGSIKDGQMQPTPAGQMVTRWWLELENKFPNVQLGEFVVMPNHFHGIIWLVTPPPAVTVGVDLRVDPGERINPNLPVDPDPNPPAIVGVDLRVDPDARINPILREEGTHAVVPLPGIIQWFKTMTTNEYIRGVKQSGWPTFRGRVWQRNYYEHIIRDKVDLNRIDEYIRGNPLNWASDTENPSH